MNKEEVLLSKVKEVYNEAKKFVDKHQYADVLSSSPDNNPTDVWNEYAKQINYTNAFKQKKKDLEFLIALLTEYKNGVGNNTPQGQKTTQRVNSYIENIKALVKVYQEIDEGQWYILHYYDKGGGCL